MLFRSRLRRLGLMLRLPFLENAEGGKDAISNCGLDRVGLETDEAGMLRRRSIVRRTLLLSPFALYFLLIFVINKSTLVDPALYEAERILWVIAHRSFIILSLEELY